MQRQPFELSVRLKLWRVSPRTACSAISFTAPAVSVQASQARPTTADAGPCVFVFEPHRSSSRDHSHQQITTLQTADRAPSGVVTTSPTACPNRRSTRGTRREFRLKGTGGPVVPSPRIRTARDASPAGRYSERGPPAVACCCPEPEPGPGGAGVRRTQQETLSCKGTRPPQRNIASSPCMQFCA